MMDPVKAAMIRTLFLQVSSQTAAAFTVAGYMVGTAWAFNPAPVVLSWAAAILAATLARWGLARLFLRKERPDDALTTWANLYVLVMAAIGTVYGVSFLLFAHPDEPITVALTLAALYSLGAGSMPPSAYYTPAIFGAVLPTFAAVLVKLLLTGDFEYILLGSASALYGVTMIRYCKVQARTLREGFGIRFENAELVEQLRQETAIADDAVRQSIEMLFRDAGYQVAAFCDAATFLDAVDNLPDGPVITDVRMPGLTGVELMAQLKVIGQQDRPVIVITGHGNVPLAVQAIRAGALDFLEKPFDPTALLEAVGAATRLGPAVASGVSLTPRERQVAEGVMRGLTSKDIADELDISYRTVQVVRARLLKKTGTPNTAALTMFLGRRPSI